MRYLVTIVTLLVFLFLSLLVSRSQAGELYVYGGIGQAESPLNNKPGLWRREGQPYTYDGTAMGFRAGVGGSYDLGALGQPAGIPLSHRIRLELGAVSPGSPEMVSALAHNDESYNAGGDCVKTCDQIYAFNVVNNLLGAELVAKYGVVAWDWLEIYASGGLAGFRYTLDVAVQPLFGGHRVEHYNSDHGFSGVMLAGVIGGGVCGTIYKGIALCGDVEKFLQISESFVPVHGRVLLTGRTGDGPVLTTFQVRVPLVIF